MTVLVSYSVIPLELGYSQSVFHISEYVQTASILWYGKPNMIFYTLQALVVDTADKYKHG